MVETSRYDVVNTPQPKGREAHASKVEYAAKAVENGGTAIGIRCKNGVVLALEKLVTSKLLKPGANKRIATVDRHMGVVSSASKLEVVYFSADYFTRSRPDCFQTADIS
jgi:20S proteasome alpha/beta subunit